MIPTKPEPPPIEVRLDYETTTRPRETVRTVCVKCKYYIGPSPHGYCVLYPKLGWWARFWKRWLT